MWLLLQGRINTKERLRRLNLLQNNDIYCVLCGRLEETTEQLFVNCVVSWSIWSECIQWGGIFWTAPNDILCFYESWLATARIDINSKAWSSGLHRWFGTFGVSETR